MMWPQPAAFPFIVRVVFAGETGSDQPTTRSTAKFSRLLHHRLEVIEAALHRLVELQCATAAISAARGRL